MQPEGDIVAVRRRLVRQATPGVIVKLQAERDARLEAYADCPAERESAEDLAAKADLHTNVERIDALLATPRSILARVRSELAHVLRRGTRESWAKIRKRIYERDAGTCHVCGQWTEPEYYDCGHIVDRCAGGSDLDWNLVCMCIVCNRVLKDVHATRAEYLAWLATEPASLRTRLADVLARR